jgi:hypothetical protein
MEAFRVSLTWKAVDGRAPRIRQRVGRHHNVTPRRPGQSPQERRLGADFGFADQRRSDKCVLRILMPPNPTSEKAITAGEVKGEGSFPDADLLELVHNGGFADAGISGDQNEFRPAGVQ